MPGPKTIDLLQVHNAANGIASGTALACGLTTPVNLEKIEMPTNASFGIFLQFTKSAGTLDIKVDWQVSEDGVNFCAPVNVAVSGVGVIVPTGTPITDLNLHFVNYAPPVSRYGRLVITGQAANPASAALTLAKIQYVQGQ